MAVEAKVYRNDMGLIIDIDMGENISTATGLSLKVKKPDGTGDAWTPSIQGTNYLRYTIQSGELNQVGTYHIQPAFTLGGWVGKGNTVSFVVYKEYK